MTAAAVWDAACNQHLTQKICCCDVQPCVGSNCHRMGAVWLRLQQDARRHLRLSWQHGLESAL